MKGRDAFEGLFAPGGGGRDAGAQSASCGPGGNGRAAAAEKSPTCASRNCDRAPRRDSVFCGLCEAARAEGFVVTVNAAKDRAAVRADQRGAPVSGIPAGGRIGG